MLNNWANMFEQNSIRSGISIAMADKNKEAVRAIAEVVEQVGEPLRIYIEPKENLGEFIDVASSSIGKNERLLPQQQQKHKISFDVLIDEDRVVQRTGTANDNVIANNLKEILRKYGCIIVKIVDGTIDKKSVESFSRSLTDYMSMSKKSLMIGDDIAQDVSKLARCHHSKNSPLSKEDHHNIILIEKPVRILSDNNDK
jgi:hypothetical protein